MSVNRQRRDAPLSHANDVEHRRQIALRANAGYPKDGSQPMERPVVLKSYTVATLPDASLWTDGLITVSNEAGGYVTAFSDGTNWRRTTDRAIVS